MPTRFTRTTRALAHDGARRALAVWGIALALLGTWLGWFFLGTVTVYETSPRARLEVQQAAHPVAALVAGKVARSHLLLGREVKAGEVLVELDGGAESLRLEEERDRLAAIPPRIASLRREIALREQAGADDRRTAEAAAQTARHRTTEADAAVAFARDHARRLEEESAVGSVPKVDALKATAETRKLMASRDALASDVRRIESEARNRDHQNRALVETLAGTIVALEGEAVTLQASVERLKFALERHVIRAPIDGRIGEGAPLQAGAWVAEGQKLATVVPQGRLMIVAEFAPAAVLGRIRPGQAARLRLDGFPWAQYGTLEARVSRVGTELRENFVRVELAPAEGALPGLTLQHGLPGAVEVSIEQSSPALLVLRTAGQWLSRPAAGQATPGATRS